jgi:phosphoribosyl 1,2-cyclic phosphate phosphodiesterase
MEIQFLGTGSAWCVPEYSCDCMICAEMSRLGEERTRTCFVAKSHETILVDCGPDVRAQMRKHAVPRPDAVLITHEHGDHYLGLDDLLCFRRSRPREDWTPIPVYATAKTWETIEVRFGYLVGSLIEKREAIPGETLEGLNTKITPFKTLHGPFALGCVGYVIEEIEDNRREKLVYTSDFVGLETEPDILFEPDVLILQAHWLNEPIHNRPHHMSFQNALDYLLRWNPKERAYLVHISGGDLVPGDPSNHAVKKFPPASPMREPISGEPYPIPRCQAEWQAVVDRICNDRGVSTRVIVAADGMVARV